MFTDDKEYKLRNQLYTACKIGDVETLFNVLSPLLPQDVKQSEHVNSTEDLTTSNAPTEEAIDQGLESSDLVLTADLLNAPFGESCTTLLHVAAARECAQAVMYLLEAGADPTRMLAFYV